MPHTKRAFDYIDSKIRVIKDEVRPSSLLYVGWRHDCKDWWLEKFCKDLGVKKVGVLEIFEKNLREFVDRQWMGQYPGVLSYFGDVREIEKYITPDEYDIIFWDHGPEHVTLEDLIVVTPKLKRFAGKMLFYCAPWGEWPQAAEDGNEFEIHRSYLTMDNILNDCDMRAAFVGREGQDGEGELIAWHIK